MDKTIITTAARRIAREVNGMQQDMGAYFDAEGGVLAYKPATADYTDPSFGPPVGRVIYLLGRRDGLVQRGHMSWHEAQVLLDAATRFGQDSLEYAEYVDKHTEQGA